MSGAGDDGVGGRTVVIIGLGLIGGSLARALAARGADVVGFDTDARQLDEAVRAGVVRRGDVEAADIVVIAVPVDAAVRVLLGLAPRLRRARLITDVGSTKASIVAAARGLGLSTRFVGAHPLAGDHRSGFGSARADLFDDATVYLTPERDTPPDAVELAVRLWTTVGARPERIDATAHDALLARTSHLPQLLASALSLTLGEAGIARDALGPGGRDMTRLAASNAELWTAIALDNAANIGAALDALEQQLVALRTAIARGDDAAVRDRLRRAAEWAVTPRPRSGA